LFTCWLLFLTTPLYAFDIRAILFYQLPAVISPARENADKKVPPSPMRSSWKRRPREIPVSVRLLAFLQRLAQQLHGMKDLDFLRRIEMRPDRQVASGAAGAENLRARRVDIGDLAFRNGL